MSQPTSTELTRWLRQLDAAPLRLIANEYGERLPIKELPGLLARLTTGGIDDQAYYLALHASQRSAWNATNILLDVVNELGYGFILPAQYQKAATPGATNTPPQPASAVQTPPQPAPAAWPTALSYNARNAFIKLLNERVNENDFVGIVSDYGYRATGKVGFLATLPGTTMPTRIMALVDDAIQERRVPMLCEAIVDTKSNLADDLRVAAK